MGDCIIISSAPVAAYKKPLKLADKNDDKQVCSDEGAQAEAAGRKSFKNQPKVLAKYLEYLKPKPPEPSFEQKYPLEVTVVIKDADDMAEKLPGVNRQDLFTQGGWAKISKALYGDDRFADKLQKLNEEENPICPKANLPIDCLTRPEIWGLPVPFTRAKLVLLVRKTPNRPAPDAVKTQKPNADVSKNPDAGLPPQDAGVNQPAEVRVYQDRVTPVKSDTLRKAKPVKANRSNKKILKGL